MKAIILLAGAAVLAGSPIPSSQGGAGLPPDAFQPPAKYAGDFGDYRSPLRFDDGTPVRSAQDWNQRRTEIREHWHGIMGEWPDLLTPGELRIEVRSTQQREDIEQRHIEFNWTPEERTDGYLLVPKGKGRRPAVVVVYYEPETAIGEGKPWRDFAIQLTRRGFVTLSIGTRQATRDKVYSIYHPSREEARVQPLSMLGYAANNAWQVLASQPEVDAQRIGIVGHSFGGKWALFASCLTDRFACAVWSDPGIVFDESRRSINYWTAWYLGYEPGNWRAWETPSEKHPRTGAYQRLIAEGRNLQELHALMAPRPFLVSGGSEDPPRRWRALNHTVAVNHLLGHSNRVAMTNRPDHSPNETSNAQIYAFFERFLMP